MFVEILGDYWFILLQFVKIMDCLFISTLNLNCLENVDIL